MRKIKGFENYMIDESGRVYNKKGYEMKQHARGKYIRVTLTKNGQLQQRSVHLLMASTYLTRPPYLLDLPVTRIVVKHKNGVQSDNRLDNLQEEDSKYKDYPYCNACFRFHRAGGLCL